MSGWIVGFVFGVRFAAASYLVWYVGAIIAAGSVGALIATGLINLLGVDTQWAIAIFAVVGAVLAAFIALAFALPVYMVIVSTAMAEATAAVAGVMLIFNQMELVHLRYGAAWALIEESWFWGSCGWSWPRSASAAK